MNRRCKREQQLINAEIDRRLMEFQTPKEIASVMRGSMTSAFLRSKKLGLINQRITDEERDFLLVRRKTATGGTAIDESLAKTYWNAKSVFDVERKGQP